MAHPERITDPAQAWVMAYAEAPFRERYQANRDNLKPEQILELGRAMGEAVAHAQLSYEPAVLRSFIDISALQAFGEARSMADKALAGRIWGVLMNGRMPAYYVPGYEHAKTMINDLRTSAAANDWQLEAAAVKDLVTHLVANIGYDQIEKCPIVTNLGPTTVSFLAEYLNTSLQLDGVDRIPLYTKRPQRK